MIIFKSIFDNKASYIQSGIHVFIDLNSLVVVFGRNSHEIICDIGRI